MYPMSHKLLPYPIQYIPAHSSAEGFAERQRLRREQAEQKKERK